MATRMREATDKRWGLWAREGPRDAVSVATELWSAAGSWEAAVRVASRTTCAGSAPRAPFRPEEGVLGGLATPLCRVWVQPAGMPWLHESRSRGR